MPGSEADDMFLPTTEADKIISSRKTSTASNQTVECVASVGSEVIGVTCSAENPIQSEELAAGESEISPSQQVRAERVDQQSAYAGVETSSIREWDGGEPEHAHSERSQLVLGVNGAKFVIPSAEDSETHGGIALTNSYEKLPPRTTDSECEVIPPLIERLSALGVSPASIDEDGGGNSHDASSMRSLISEASRLKIASVKER